MYKNITTKYIWIYYLVWKDKKEEKEKILNFFTNNNTYTNINNYVNTNANYNDNTNVYTYANTTIIFNDITKKSKSIW